MGALAFSIAILLLISPCKGQLPQDIASLLENLPASDQPSVMASLAQLNPQELPIALTANPTNKLKELCQLLSTLPKPLPGFCASPPPIPAVQSPPPATPAPSLPPAAAPPVPGVLGDLITADKVEHILPRTTQSSLVYSRRFPYGSLNFCRL